MRDLWLFRQWRSMALRTKLTLATSLLMLGTVIVTAFLTATLYRHELLRQIDQDIYASRNNVSSFMRSTLSENTQDAGKFEQSIVRFYGELWDPNGKVMVRVQQEGTDGPKIEPLDFAQVDQRGPIPFDAPGVMDENDEWRVHIYKLESARGSVAIALPLKPVEVAVGRVTTLVVTIGIFATIIATIVAYLVVTNSLRPLNRVERTAAKIAAGDLTQRVEYGPPDTEVGRLSRSLNAMLAHIEIAFRDKEASENRMRRFIQDASHELRTPLVTIRGFSELYRHGGISKPEDVGTAMGRIESEAVRMGQLVEDLLTLARLDEQRPLESGPVDLLVLASDLVVDTQVSAPERTITLVGLDTDSPEPAPTVGDQDRLRQVISNLMTNALRYTPEGTPIEVAVGTTDTLPPMPDPDGGVTPVARESVIEIRDHGPGISEEDAARIFERFYRADSSRHRETGGTGLGLAIVAAITAQHGGSVRHRETEGGGATMIVQLPWAADSADEELEETDDAEAQDAADETNSQA